MNNFDYWSECIAQSADDHKIQLTPEQIKLMATDVMHAHDNIHMAFPVPELSHDSELTRVRKELAIERAKIHCDKCGGSGWLKESGPYHGSQSQCHKCKGEGRFSPK